MTPERLQQIIELEQASRPWPVSAEHWMIAARQALRELLAEVLPVGVAMNDGITIEPGPGCRIVPDDDPRMVACRELKTRTLNGLLAAAARESTFTD